MLNLCYIWLTWRPACQSFVFYYTVQCCPAWQLVWCVIVASCGCQLDFNKELLFTRIMMKKIIITLIVIFPIMNCYLILSWFKTLKNQFGLSVYCLYPVKPKQLIFLLISDINNSTQTLHTPPRPKCDPAFERDFMTNPDLDVGFRIGPKML